MRSYEQVQENLKRRPRAWLVTGAAGFIGSHVVQALLKLDQRVVGLDNLSAGSRGNLTQVAAAVTETEWRNFRFLQGDINAIDTCRQACRGVDYVLHQAALGSVSRSVADPVCANENNVTGFMNMLVAAQGAGVARFVYAGSSAVYGDDTGIPKIEEHVGRPLSPYAATKRVDEMYADVFARCFGLGSIGLRYFNVFGPRQEANGPYAAVIPVWIAAMLRNEIACIFGDGETTRDFCYVDNVVRANVLAATVEDPAAANQVYNVAMGCRTSLNELFETIRSLLEGRYAHLRGLKPVYRDFRHGDVLHSQADISKAQRLLGYFPNWRLTEGLSRTIDWFADRLAAPRPIGAQSGREPFDLIFNDRVTPLLNIK
ncbi:MAG: SDR family oxidoreductase, partial [Betaproteobacteria bacterium]